MPTPINPKDNLNPPPPASKAAQSTNNNIAMLAYLYDNTAFDLQKALASQEILVTDERIKSKVRWLGEIAKSLSLVYQIESMRATPKENSLALPSKNVVAVDPALKKANSRKNFNPNAPQNLGQFPSPGGWTP
jgi:hypothetical protein